MYTVYLNARRLCIGYTMFSNVQDACRATLDDLMWTGQATDELMELSDLHCVIRGGEWRDPELVWLHLECPLVCDGELLGCTSVGREGVWRYALGLEKEWYPFATFEIDEQVPFDVCSLDVHYRTFLNPDGRDGRIVTAVKYKDEHVYGFTGENIHKWAFQADICTSSERAVL